MNSASASLSENPAEVQEVVRAQPANSKRIASVIQLAIIFIAALYWSKYVFLDAPFVYHSDEPDVVGRAVRMLLTGDFNPHWFHWPTLLIYMNAAVLKTVDVMIKLPLEQGLAMGVRGPNPQAFILYEICRFVTICFSVGTLFLLLRLTTRFTNPFMASLAGISFIGSNVVFASAARVTVDMPVTFFAFASLTMMVWWVDSERSGQTRERYYWLAIVLGGLAAGTKYNGAAVLFVAPVALWLAGVRPARAFRLLALGAIVSTAVFLLTTPYALLDARTFLSPNIGMLYDFHHYASGHPGADEGIAFLKLVRDLWVQHSVLAFFVLLLPAGLIKKDYPRSLLLVVALLVLMVLMVGSAKVYFTRNILPAIPIIDCLSVTAIWAVAKSFRKEGQSKFLFAGIIAAVFLLAGFTAFSSVRKAGLAQRQVDSRTAAYEWIMANIPPNSRIIHEAFCPQLFYSGRFRVEYARSLSNLPFDELVRANDYIVTSETQWKRYGNLYFRSYDEVFKLPLLKEWSSKEADIRGPAIRIYATRQAGVGE